MSYFVRRVSQRAAEVVDFGDPEPTDVTVALNGSIYWTCSSADVLVQARRQHGGSD